MNASGRAIKKLCTKFEVPADSRFILVHDDLDIKLGSFKIQKGIGPKKHNGVDSVQMSLGRTDFLRVRIGVENRESGSRIPGEDYVLTQYSDEENSLLKETCSDAFKNLRSLIQV
jgi:PTH1 family peptidyl-tRNA hydrolase